MTKLFLIAESASDGEGDLNIVSSSMINRKYIYFFIGIIILIAGSVVVSKLAYTANGYAAKYLCSHTYTSGLDTKEGFELYVKPMHFLFNLAKIEANKERKELTSSFFGFLQPRTAIWREGCGCTLLVDKSAEQLHLEHHLPHRITERDTTFNTNALWPNGSNISRDSLPTNINWDAVDNLLDEAMRETTSAPVHRRNTVALVVARKGQIIGERYAEGVSENTPLLGWSCAKSITGALTGVMVKDHQLDINRPIGLPEWANDERRDITIDHLLRMESGLDFDENYLPFTDATKMLYGCTDMGAFAAEHPPAAPPGTRWSYSSGTTNLLSDLLYRHIGGTPEALHHLAYDEFFNRLGITTAVFEHDESDAFVGSSYLYMSARDWMRVCKLYMDDGIWNGNQILPEGWVNYSLAATPNAPDGCYGVQIWLNASSDANTRKLSGLPADLFMFHGFQGQWIVGIPSMDLMLVRIAVMHKEEKWNPQDLIIGLMDELN